MVRSAKQPAQPKAAQIAANEAETSTDANDLEEVPKGGKRAEPAPPTRGKGRRGSDAVTASTDAAPQVDEAKRRRLGTRNSGAAAAAATAPRLGGKGHHDEEGGPSAKGKAPLRGSLHEVTNPTDSDAMFDAVVKVFVVHCEPNFSLPWQRKRQYSSSSTGFIIEGRRILTNAHCIDHHTQVKLKRRGSDEKFVATVLAIGAECDLALLTVDEPRFWSNAEPVKFGTLPALQDPVMVVGYPIGGDTMSVTSGVVSRMEVTSYVHGASELLGIQIDAAINSGNSGGPAFSEEGMCIGVAFQSLKHEDAENIGYVIPTPVVKHFINDYERNKQYTGFPNLGLEWQKVESPDLREMLKMKSNQKGVMVRRLEPTAAASKVLHINDVLLSFDGIDIANDGTVPFRSGERIGFSYLVSQKYVDEEATLRVLHAGKEVSVKVKLLAPVRLIPWHIRNEPPSYFIVAGIVFTPITVPYLRSEYGKDYEFDAPVKLLDKMVHSMAAEEGEQVVVMSQVLAAEINIGYEDIVNTQVRTINGKKVSNLKDLVRAVDGNTGLFLELDLEFNQKVVLNAKRAKAATSEILITHCIPSDRSADLVGKL